ATQYLMKDGCRSLEEGGTYNVVQVGVDDPWPVGVKLSRIYATKDCTVLYQGRWYFMSNVFEEDYPPHTEIELWDSDPMRGRSIWLPFKLCLGLPRQGDPWIGDLWYADELICEKTRRDALDHEGGVLLEKALQDYQRLFDNNERSVEGQSPA